MISRSALNGNASSFCAESLERKVPSAPASRSMLLEGEDALLNGMTRSLHRRLIGLNIFAEAQSTAKLDAAKRAA